MAVDILRRMRSGLGRRLSVFARRVLGLDARDRAVDQQLEALYRTTSETLAHVRRLGVLEATLDRLEAHGRRQDLAIEHHSARILTGLQEGESRIAKDLTAIGATIEARTLDQGRAVLEGLQASETRLAEALRATVDRLQNETLSAFRNRQEADAAALAGLVSPLSDSLAQTAGSVQAAFGAVDTLRVAVETLIGRLDSLSNSLGAQLQATQSALGEPLALAGEAGVQAPTLTALASEARAVTAETLALARRIDTALLRRPLYLQEGLTAVTRLGGWDGHPLAVPTSHLGVWYGHATLGAEAGEPGVRTALRALIRPGDVAVDIGAHVGVHSVIMGFHVGEEGRLLCFEPDPELAAALQHTMHLNGYMRRSIVTQAAVSDEVGVASFHRTRHSPESTLFPGPEHAGRDAIDVPVTTLDSAITPGGRVDLVKIDAEGAEARIYRGMRRVLAENRRISLIVEFAPSHFERAGESAKNYLEQVVKDGFELLTIAEPDGQIASIGLRDALKLRTANLLLRRT